MRPIHLQRILPGHVVVPRCGDWGSMDTDWTDDLSAVTCQACLEAARRDHPTPEPSAAPGRTANG